MLDKSILYDNEEIIWSGSPQLIGKLNVPLILINILIIFVGIFTFILGIGIIYFFLIKNKIWIVFSIVAFVIGFFALTIGFYLILGRIIYKAIKKINTCYTITNKRIIVEIKEFNNKIVQIANISNIEIAQKEIFANGVGSIKFGKKLSIFELIYTIVGVDFLVPINYKFLALQNIKDANEVLNIIKKIKI